MSASRMKSVAGGGRITIGHGERARIGGRRYTSYLMFREE